MEKIFAGLKKGNLAPCYLLYGEEEYLINEALNKMLDVIIPQNDRDFGLFYLDGENLDLDGLIKDILTPSLLGGRKVIVVKNAAIFASKDDLVKLIGKIRDAINDNPAKAVRHFLTFLSIAGLALEDLQDSGWQKITDEQWSAMVKGDAGDDRSKWLPRVLEICRSSGITDSSGVDKTEKLEDVLKTGLPAGNCLIFTAETVDKRKKIFKIINESGDVIHFGGVKKEFARREILQNQVQKLLDESGKKMSPAAWVALGKKTGFDLRRSVSELEKLIAFTGDRPLIGQDDVEEAVGLTREDEIFALTNALGEKNQQAALDALKNILDQGVHHLMVLTMITREIRLLLQARLLVDSGKLPKFNNTMEYGWFQKTLYPAVSALNTAGVKRDGLIFSQHPYSIYNALRNGLRFTTARLLTLQEDLLHLERSLKTSGTSNARLVIENFLLKACN